MLLHYIAFGIIAAGGGGGGGGDGPFTDTGAVTIASSRTAVLAAVQPASTVGSGIPLGSSLWAQQFDPADHAPYVLDFAALLDTDEKIVEIESVVMNATAALLGVEVDTASGFGPLIDTAGKVIQLWFVVDEASWAESSFDAGGVLLPVTVRVHTDDAQPKRFERTGVLTVRQL